MNCRREWPCPNLLSFSCVASFPLAFHLLKEKIWIFRWVLENQFWNNLWKLWRNVGNFEKIFEIFWNDLVEEFRIFVQNLVKTSKKCGKNYGINFGLILGKLWKNIGATLNYQFWKSDIEMLKMFFWDCVRESKKVPLLRF